MPKIKETDLEKFVRLFGFDLHKEYAGCIEYRVSNLDRSITTAREIINKNNLQLEARTTGRMAQIRAFEVIEL